MVRNGCDIIHVFYSTGRKILHYNLEDKNLFGRLSPRGVGMSVNVHVQFDDSPCNVHLGHTAFANFEESISNKYDRYFIYRHG